MLGELFRKKFPKPFKNFPEYLAGFLYGKGKRHESF